MGSLCRKAPHRKTPVELEEILTISRKQYRAPQIDGEYFKPTPSLPLLLGSFRQYSFLKFILNSKIKI
jgi:hypothetical protein